MIYMLPGMGTKIVVVDDEPAVADSYALRLRTEYDEVETVYSGKEAIRTIDDDTDIVLLDRRMPEVSGDDVLTAVRDRGLDCRVIMITAVRPDFDIINMSFDDYLCKPVKKEDLFSAIDQQLRGEKYDDRVTEYFNVMSTIAALKTEKTDAQLANNTDYQRLKRRRDELSAEIDQLVNDSDDFSAALRSIK